MHDDKWTRVTQSKDGKALKDMHALFAKRFKNVK
jgi:hypothetical protein